MKKELFYSLIPFIDELYGVLLDEDLVETWGLVAYHKIGNKDYRLKHIVAKVLCGKEPKDWYIEKPCDMDLIELITLPFEDAQETSSVMNFPDTYTRPIENWIEGNKIDMNALYMSGKMVHYNEIGNRIYFSEPFTEVHILYKTYSFDPNDLPYLNQKELFAIATYCAYCYFYRKGLSTKDSATIQLAQLLKKDWQKACGEARNPEYLSLNDGNEILNAMTSYDRHIYNKTQKIIR